MDYWRVTIDPGGLPVHWIRPSVQFRRSVLACTATPYDEGHRLRRRPVGPDDLRCAACREALRVYLEGLHEYWESITTLDFGGDTSRNVDQSNAGDG